MKKKKFAGLLAAAMTAVTVCTTMAYAGSSYVAAPDGSTKAENTAAAANGAYEAWKESWKTISEDWTQVSLTPGADETQMNFAWYSKKSETTGFQYGKSKDLSDAKTVEIAQTDAQEGYYSNKVTLENLEANTTYYYQVAGKGTESFTTKDSGNFSFIFVGDPQIGSSNAEKAKKPEDIAKATFKTAQYESVQSDSFNWANTLNQAMVKTNGEAGFVLSAGDQIQTNALKVKDNTVSEMEYAGYLSPSVLKSLPVATTVGNHDADNPNYQYHFNIPNLSTLGANKYVGGDYCFTYGDALFIMLNTQDTNTAEHEAFIKQAVEKYPDAAWRIVTLHQDIYGSAEHSNEPEIVNLRYALVPYFEKYDVDVVLTGHDHAYSRSELLKDGVKAITYTDDEFDEQLEKDIDVGEAGKSIQLTTSPGNIKSDTTDVKEKAYLDYLNTIMDADAVVETAKNQDTIIDSEGILYITANSASGSKYYDLVARQQTYIAARWQEDVPTYSVIEVDETSFTINTYRTDTNEAIDKQVTLVKSVSKDALSSEVAKMEGLDLKADAYTENSWNLYTAALNGAKTVVEDAKADSSTVESALAALKASYAALEKAEVKDTTDAEKNDDTNTSTADGNADTDNNDSPAQKGDSDIKTGDTSASIWYCLLGITSIISFGGIYIVNKKKNRKVTD